jgi:aspartate aminotransferase
VGWSESYMDAVTDMNAIAAAETEAASPIGASPTVSPVEASQAAASPVSNRIEEANKSASLVRKMFEEGNRLKAIHGADKVFDFSLGNPNVEPPEVFQKVLEELAADRTPGMHGYMSNAGYLEARMAVADYLSGEQGMRVPADNIVMTAGAAAGANVIFRAILDPGDEVIVSRPFFMEYRAYVGNYEGVLVPVPSLDDFGLDLAAIEAAITPRTRAVLIDSPNNPTGRVYPAASLAALGDLLRRASAKAERIIYLVSDEPYRKVVYDGARVPPIFQAYEATIMTTSYSKELSLSGERIGYVAAHPDSPGVERLMEGLILTNRILGFVNAPALMQRVVARLQGVTSDFSLYRRNREVLYGALVGAGYTVRKPEGAFYVFPKAPVADDVAFAKELVERLVLVVPGSGFGVPGYFRMAYCVAPEVVDGALPALRELGEKYFGRRASGAADPAGAGAALGGRGAAPADGRGGAA